MTTEGECTYVANRCELDRAKTSSLLLTAHLVLSVASLKWKASEAMWGKRMVYSQLWVSNKKFTRIFPWQTRNQVQICSQRDQILAILVKCDY